jgi:hypothetical protein
VIETTDRAMATHIIHSRDDLVEVLRARKAQLGLSNAFVEAQLLMSGGGCDKVLGPAQVKGMSVAVMFDLIELFGGRLVFQVDPEIEAKMRPRWEKREERNVRRAKRLSKAVLARAAPLLFAALGKAGGTKRAKSLTAKQRKEIARTAALSRWRIHRAAVRARAVAAAQGAPA